MKTSRSFFCWIFAAALCAAALPLSAKSLLVVGERTPLFAGHDQDGNLWNLSEHLGKKVVFVYFYSKDNTDGGSAEACSLRDNLVELKLEGVDVVGVSFDNKKTHKEFAFKYNLSFPLLADTNGQIADAFGARMDGDSKLDRRISFLIGLDGRIIHITDSPNPAVQVNEMLAAVAKLTGKVAP